MTFVLMSTGMIYEAAETRAAVKGALGGAAIDLTIGGEVATFRTSAVMGAADAIEALRPTFVRPIGHDDPPPTAAEEVDAS